MTGDGLKGLLGKRGGTVAEENLAHSLGHREYGGAKGLPEQTWVHVLSKLSD